MELGIGRTGAAIVLVLFLVLTAEDIVIWAESGAVPGLEFFVATVIVLLVWVDAIRTARQHPPRLR